VAGNAAETYERALRGRATFQPGTNLRLWLMTIMYNLFLDRCRKQTREPRVIAVDEGDIPNPEAYAPEPWESITSEQVHAAVERLEPLPVLVLLLLDLLHLPYTGSGPSGLLLAQDKAVAKRLFTFHGLRTPHFATVYQGRLQWSDDIHFPVIVKPKREDGSIGIEFNAVVGSIKELMERIDALHADLDSPVLIEEYIEGRELYVSVLGNEASAALPVVELDLSDLPEGTPRIAGTEVKWERGTDAYKKTKLRVPEDLSEQVLAEIQETAVTACRALEIRDYARADLRLTPEGRIYLLEVNPNPWLHPTAEFALAAKQAGRDYVSLIEEIVGMALARYRGRTLTDRPD
jgi:D-alanine-D-alanine ligase